MERYNEGVDCIPNHVWISLDEDKIVYFSVPVVSIALLIRRYQFFLAVIELYSIVKRVVLKSGL